MIYTPAGLLRRSALAAISCLLLGGGVTSAQDVGTFAFVGVNVIPMDTERVLSRYTVVVQGDRILAIDPEDEASLPRGTREIDARGRYLIPGLADVHAELLADRRIAGRLVDEELVVMVANGVTAWRAPAGSRFLLDLRERIAADDVVAPTVYVATPRLTSDALGEAPGTRVVTTPFEAAAAVREYKNDGYDFAALGFALSPDIYQGIVLTARGSRLPLIGSIPAGVGLLRAFETGQQITHLDGYLEALAEDEQVDAVLSGPGLWKPENWALLEDLDDGRIDDLVRATVEAEIWNAPTLAYYATTFGRRRSPAEIDQSPEHRFVSASVRADLLSAGERFWTNPPDADLRRRFVELRDRLVRDLHRAQANLLVGSGAPEAMMLYGFGVHRELEAMVAAGLTPFAALTAATSAPAAFLSWGGGGRTEYATVDEGAIRFESTVGGGVDFGVVDVGKRANLVLLGSNPLDDIVNTRDIEGVVLRGRWLPRDDLDELLDNAAEKLSREPLLR